jgi:hypothetical protein
MKLRQGKQSSQARSIGYVLSVPSRPEQIIDEWHAGDPSMSDVVENRSRAGVRTAIIKEANTDRQLKVCVPVVQCFIDRFEPLRLQLRRAWAAASLKAFCNAARCSNDIADLSARSGAWYCS